MLRAKKLLKRRIRRRKMKIELGSAGTSGLGYPDGLKKCNELGIGMEVEFTYGVRMSDSDAKKIGDEARRLGVKLSVHAPYYVNLASKDKVKLAASKERILQSCERGHSLGAKYIVFHPGFYQGRDEEEVYKIIKEGIVDLLKEVKRNKWDVFLAPETTGKGSQFGDLDELLRLVKETGCSICVDFAHLKARNNGKIDYDEVFLKLKGLGHIHAHFSGIEWTAKGERKHLITDAKDILELVKYIKKYGLDVTIINESPDTFGDCVKSLKIIDEMK